MKRIIQDGKYDVEIEASDWRYSAAIVGLQKYLKFHHLEEYFEVKEDVLYYKSEVITEKRYLEYVEYTYSGEFHHKIVELQLFYDEFPEENIKKINERLSGNTIMKKIFGKLKFDGTNKREILDLIEENREELIRETYRNKNNLYKNFCNTNFLFQEASNCCRLVGFYFDAPKKGKSASYGFDKAAFQWKDIVEFDFIPFAFTGDREVFFINDSVTLNRLYKTNTALYAKVKQDMEEKDSFIPDVRRAFFKLIIDSAEFINYDVEVIIKRRDSSYFETMFIRKKSIRIFQSLQSPSGTKDKYKSLCFSFKINDNYYINIQKEVTDCILNLALLDKLIELFLKEGVKGSDYSYITKLMIDLNVKIRGGFNMRKIMEDAKRCGTAVAHTIPDNKLNSYRQKLTSAIVFKDYDRVCQVILQLSNYSNVTFDFAYELFEDFEKNKDIAYTFINSLRTNNKAEVVEGGNDI